MMIQTEALAVMYGLGSAISWGAGDFSGGFATKRGNVLAVILFSELIGTGFLAGLAVWSGEPIPAMRYMLTGGIAGMFGTLGLIALYRSLAAGRMGVAASLSALTTAMLPIIWAGITIGLPDASQIMGFVLAVVAIWLLTSDPESGWIRSGEWELPVLAGIGFGMYFILIGQTGKVSVFWPLVSSHIFSILMILLLFLVRENSRMPGRKLWPIIAVTGILNVAGSGFFAMASRMGRLDVSAVLASMYPAATVFLAWLILHEKLKRRHWAGVLFALAALGFISG